MIEQDEDEDPTRMCVKCGERPRWSRHLNARYCVRCNGKSVRQAIALRKQDGPEPGPSCSPYAEQRRVWYRLLRLAGANCTYAGANCKGPNIFARAMTLLLSTPVDERHLIRSVPR